MAYRRYREKDSERVDKKACQHTDCVNRNWDTIKCTVKDCKEHMRTMHGPPRSPVTKESVTIVKEVVMIPCQYCGGLMPQTSIFCPSCGARRKV